MNPPSAGPPCMRRQAGERHLLLAHLRRTEASACYLWSYQTMMRTCPWPQAPHHRAWTCPVRSSPRRSCPVRQTNAHDCTIHTRVLPGCSGLYAWTLPYTYNIPDVCDMSMRNCHHYWMLSWPCTLSLWADSGTALDDAMKKVFPSEKQFTGTCGILKRGVVGLCIASPEVSPGWSWI